MAAGEPQGNAANACPRGRGSPRPPVSLDREACKYIRLEFQDDRLVGALTLGRTDFVGVLRGLIQGRVPLGPWKDKLTDDPHRIMEAYLAGTMA